MIFAVSMTFIDQTIVSIAVPQIQRELGLSSTGVQWAVNAYLLSLAALFAFGGRLADTMGHTRMCVIGVIVFASASALCGLTPKAAWRRAGSSPSGRCRAPVGRSCSRPPSRSSSRPSSCENAARTRVVLRIAGGLTAIGPILGGVLTQWTWRAIFWVNIPSP